MTEAEARSRAWIKRHVSPNTLVRLRCALRGMPIPRWGNLRRLQPFSSHYGFERGVPVDRFYLDRFLAEHARAITGRVLEIQHTGYTRKYGSGLLTTDTVDINPTFAPTYVCDLAQADIIPSNAYDCFLLPNTLCVLRDIRNCMRHMIRVVKPGGVVLAATAALGPLEPGNGDYWRMSASGWSEFAAEVWKGHDVQITGHGNCVAAVAATLGLAQEELTREELTHQDDRYPVLVTLYCRKSSA